MENNEKVMNFAEHIASIPKIIDTIMPRIATGNEELLRGVEALIESFPYQVLNNMSYDVIRDIAESSDGENAVKLDTLINNFFSGCLGYTLKDLKCGPDLIVAFNWVIIGVREVIAAHIKKVKAFDEQPLGVINTKAVLGIREIFSGLGITENDFDMTRLNLVYPMVHELVLKALYTGDSKVLNEHLRKVPEFAVNRVLDNITTIKLRIAEWARKKEEGLENNYFVSCLPNALMDRLVRLINEYGNNRLVFNDLVFIELAEKYTEAVMTNVMYKVCLKTTTAEDFNYDYKCAREGMFNIVNLAGETAMNLSQMTEDSKSK